LKSKKKKLKKDEEDDDADVYDIEDDLETELVVSEEIDDFVDTPELTEEDDIFIPLEQHPDFEDDEMLPEDEVLEIDDEIEEVIEDEEEEELEEEEEEK
jgi:DNA-directed RNA polymerase subunit delta